MQYSSDPVWPAVQLDFERFAPAAYKINQYSRVRHRLILIRSLDIDRNIGGICITVMQYCYCYYVPIKSATTGVILISNILNVKLRQPLV